MGIPSMDVVRGFDELAFFDALGTDTHLHQIQAHIVNAVHYAGMRIGVALVGHSQIAVRIDLQYADIGILFGVGLHVSVGYCMF